MSVFAIRFYLVLLGALIVIVDRISKYIALSAFEQRGVLLYSDSLMAHYAPGIYAYGLTSLPFSLVMTVFVLYVMGTVLYVRRFRGCVLVVVGIMLVSAGALGNMIDRILYGHVIDWIVIGKSVACNVADIAIGVGIALLVATILSRQCIDKVHNGTLG